MEHSLFIGTTVGWSWWYFKQHLIGQDISYCCPNESGKFHISVTTPPGEYSSFLLVQLVWGKVERIVPKHTFISLLHLVARMSEIWTIRQIQSWNIKI